MCAWIANYFWKIIFENIYGQLKEENIGNSLYHYTVILKLGAEKCKYFGLKLEKCNVAYLKKKFQVVAKLVSRTVDFFK